MTLTAALMIMSSNFVGSFFTGGVISRLCVKFFKERLPVGAEVEVVVLVDVVLARSVVFASV